MSSITQLATNTGTQGMGTVGGGGFYGGQSSNMFGPNKGAMLSHDNTYGVFNSLFGGMDAPYWQSRMGQKINNFFTTAQEVYRNQEYRFLSVLMDSAIAVQASSPVVAIVAPYIKAYTQVFKYTIYGFNILPAQPTVVGVGEPTNSTTEMTFSVSTREYGISCMNPVDIMFTPLQNEMRRDIMILTTALSLSMAFIQVVLIHFCTFGTINLYMKNFGYNYKNKHCDSSLIEACEKHSFGIGNDGPAHLLRGLDYYFRAVRHPPGRETTFVLITPELLPALSTQFGLRELTELNAYTGYVQPELGQSLVGIKRVYRMPPGSGALSLPGQGVVFLVVPTIPISPRMSLPHVLRSIGSICQFYYIPQRAKLSYVTGPQKNVMCVYHLPDDKRRPIQPKELLMHSGLWNTSTGEFSDHYRRALDRINGGFPEFNSGNKYIPWAKDDATRREVNEHLPDHKDTIQRGNVNTEMPFMHYNEKTKKNEFANYIYEISPSTFPNSQCLEGARSIDRTFPKSGAAIDRLMQLVRRAVNTPPTPELVKWVIESNKNAIAAAGPTPPTRNPYVTYASTSRDVGRLDLDPIKIPVGSIIAGMGHSLDSVAQLLYARTGSGTDVKQTVEQVADVLNAVNDDLASNEVIMSSALTKMIPAWKHQTKDVAAALASGLETFIPAFVIGRSATGSVLFLNHAELTRALPLRDLAKTNASFFFRYWLHLTIKNKKNVNAVGKNVDYVISKLDKKLPTTKVSAKDLSAFTDEVLALYDDPAAGTFSYGQPGAATTTLETACTFANELAKVFVTHNEEPPSDLYEQVMQAVASGKTLDTVLHDSVKPAVINSLKTLTLPVTKIAGDENSTRIPYGFSRGAWLTYLQANSDDPLILPGDWETGYGTSYKDVNMAVRALNTIPKEHSIIREPPIFEVKSKKVEPDVAAAAAAAPAPTPSVALGAGESVSAYAGHPHAKHPISGAGMGIDPLHAGIYQTALSPTAKFRFNSLDKQAAYGLTQRLIWLLQIYLHIPTNLFAIATLAEAGIWFPGDGVGFRNMLFETWSMIVLSDGCSQAVINPPKVVQAANSYNNEWKVKSTIACGVIPRVLDGLFNVRHIMIERNLSGMTATFVTNPQQQRFEADRTGRHQNTPAMIAMLVATTDNLGDCVSWNDNKIHENAMVLSRADGAHNCPRRPLIFNAFYKHYYPAISSAAKTANDQRNSLVKGFYNQNGNVQMSDFDAAIRQFATNDIICDTWFNGPRADFETKGELLRPFAGHGPLAEPHHQCEGARAVYCNKQYYFDRLQDPRALGQAKI